MAEIRHYINGQDLGEPRNWKELEITIDWLNKNEQGGINLAELEFVGRANNYLQNRIMNGLSGGVGIFEGEPYRIEVGTIGNPEFVFEGYLDFTDDVTVLGGEEIVCTLKKKKGEDWLNDVADGFSFAYLYDKGVINNGDFVKVPYVINYIPDGLELITLSISIYMMTKELIENIQRLSDSVADVIDASVPVIGVSVGLGAGVVTAWDIGNFILTIIKVVVRIAYIVAMVIAIINLIESLFNQLLPAKREHLGMTFTRMFQKCCQHLGLTLNSQLLNSDVKNWTLIPQKSAKGGKSGETGFPTNTDSITTFGDLIRQGKQLWNADFRIKDGVFYYERRDKFETIGQYQMPRYFNDQKRLLQVSKFNTNEVISNYNINWQYDTQDQNTLDNQEGRIFQAITSSVSTNNADFVTIKGSSNIEIPFTLGVEKRELTQVEEVAKGLGSIVDGLTGIFGGGTNFESQIEKRVGSLLMSSHFLTVGKVVHIKGKKLTNDQRKIFDARKLWNDYHFINSFALYNGEHNQYYRYLSQKVPMTIDQFFALNENNIGLDQEGNKFIIEKVVYSTETDTAIIDYRVKKEYTKNLKIELV